MGKNEKHGRTKCWEFKKYGRKKDGGKKEELGIYPAFELKGSLNA